MVGVLDLRTTDRWFKSSSALSSATLGRLITYVPLSPSSIIWYQPTGGDALWLGR